MEQAPDRGFAPLVSIVVPLADHAGHGAQRLASADAQDWPAIEVVAVDTAQGSGRPNAVAVPGAALGPAICAGIRASRGQYLCLLLPGTSYLPHKVRRQVEYALSMELPDAVIFCDHLVQQPGRPETVVAIASVDPAALWPRWLWSVAPHPASLLLPREALEDCQLPTEGPVDAALFAVCVRLARARVCVGLGEPLLAVQAARPDGQSRRRWRRTQDALLQEYLEARAQAAPDAALLATLGDIAQARLDAGLPAAAWDALRAGLRLLPRAGSPLAGLRALGYPLLRGLYRSVPPRLRATLRTRAQAPRQGPQRLDFARIYRANGFGGTESLSGAGSTRFQTRVLRRELPALLRRHGVRSLLDIPCGDFHWMREVELDGVDYVGADLVPKLVQANQARYGSSARRFQTADLVAGPLPSADLVLCRDCLVHLPLADAQAALATIGRSGSAWLLATTFPATRENLELDAAGWRPLNLCLAPFHLPAPVELLVERCTEAGGRAADKALGLWRVADLPAPAGL